MGIEPTSNPWQGLIITIILYLHKLVGEVGADPTTPEDKGFTVPRVCRFATLRLKWHAVQELNPYLMVRSHPFFPLN